MDEPIEDKRRSVELAKKLLASNDGYLDNILELYDLSWEFYDQIWETEFHVIGVIESDTDHLPTKEVRKHCSEKMLRAADKEIVEIIEFYKKDLESACNQIINKYGNV